MAVDPDSCTEASIQGPLHVILQAVPDEEGLRRAFRSGHQGSCQGTSAAKAWVQASGQWRANVGDEIQAQSFTGTGISLWRYMAQSQVDSQRGIVDLFSLIAYSICMFIHPELQD